MSKKKKKKTWRQTWNQRVWSAVWPCGFMDIKSTIVIVHYDLNHHNSVIHSLHSNRHLSAECPAKPLSFFFRNISVEKKKVFLDEKAWSLDFKCCILGKHFFYNLRFVGICICLLKTLVLEDINKDESLLIRNVPDKYSIPCHDTNKLREPRERPEEENYFLL